ncbi:MAG: cryptochrome/photolyase family protein [Kiloniellales bacterium]
MSTRNLILILGDQLSNSLSSLRDADPERDRLVMAEVAEEADYVPHHCKKLAFVFSAMRHAAREWAAAGWQIDYTKLDDKTNAGSLFGELEAAAKRHKAEAVRITAPGEHRLKQEIESWEARLGLPVELLDDDRFLCSTAEFDDWAEGRKQLRMEHFYRRMRRKTGLLMDGDSPAGGRWNFDAENRKAAKAALFMPKPHRVRPDKMTAEVLDMVEAHFPDRFGSLRPFWFAVTREQALKALDLFVEEALPHFGDYQDAMLEGEPFLYHSVLSLYLNAGLLEPLEICRRVEAAYLEGKAPLNAAEGYIRQIIGWREYVRGIYWRFMPDYLERNALNASRPLPDFYWTAETDMACLKAAIGQTRDEAYAHHIQRLMITGNFAMLAGVDPKQVHAWYLAVYADAYEWVELPNTLGMSQFADGGLLGSKPYAASGNYINKMSDYCAGCRYDVKQKTGEGACPFNPLYWDFLLRNEERLRGNPRLAQVYRTWERMKPETQAAYRDSAARILSALR